LSEIIWEFGDSIAALLPTYAEGRGRLTRVLLSDGSEELINKTVKGAVKKLARKYSVDLGSVVKEYGKLLGKSNLIPIPLSQHIILVPLKTVTPLLPGDSAYGYFTLSAISEIKKTGDKEYKTVVILHNGVEVGVFLNYETVMKQVKNAELVDKHYRIKHFCWLSDKSVSLDTERGLSQEVTRRDLVSIHLKLDQMLTLLFQKKC